MRRTRAEEEDAEKEEEGKEEAEEEEGEGGFLGRCLARTATVPAVLQKVSRALLRCIGSFLQQQRARRRALPRETKQRCTGRFLQQQGTAEHAAARCVAWH